MEARAEASRTQRSSCHSGSRPHEPRLHEAQSKRWSPPKALKGARARAHTPAGRASPAAPLWPEAVQCCHLSAPRGTAAPPALRGEPSRSSRPQGHRPPACPAVCAWSGGSSSVSPGRTASQHQPWPKTPNQPRQPQRGPLPLEKDSVFRPQGYRAP